METDKAVMDVESPYDGKLIEWTAEEGAVLPIGVEVAKMEVADGVKEMAAGHGPPDDGPLPSSPPSGKKTWTSSNSGEIGK